MKEKKQIIVDENGVCVEGVEQEDILPMLINAVCHVWDKDVGSIDIIRGGMNVVDALHRAEMDYKVMYIWDAVFDKDSVEGEEDD